MRTLVMTLLEQSHKRCVSSVSRFSTGRTYYRFISSHWQRGSLISRSGVHSHLIITKLSSHVVSSHQEFEYVASRQKQCHIILDPFRVTQKWSYRISRLRTQLPFTCLSQLILSAIDLSRLTSQTHCHLVRLTLSNPRSGFPILYSGHNFDSLFSYHVALNLVLFFFSRPFQLGRPVKLAIQRKRETEYVDART